MYLRLALVERTISIITFPLPRRRLLSIEHSFAHSTPLRVISPAIIAHYCLRNSIRPCAAEPSSAPSPSLSPLLASSLSCLVLAYSPSSFKLSQPIETTILCCQIHLASPVARDLRLMHQIQQSSPSVQLLLVSHLPHNSERAQQGIYHTHSLEVGPRLGSSLRGLVGEHLLRAPRPHMISPRIHIPTPPLIKLSAWASVGMALDASTLGS